MQDVARGRLVASQFAFPPLVFSLDLTSRELLLLRLVPSNDRNGHQILVNAAVQFEGVHDHLVRFLVRSVGSVALRPSKISSS